MPLQAGVNDVVYPYVTTEDIHASLGKSPNIEMAGVLSVSGWRLEDVRDLTLHIVDEVEQRPHSVIRNIMITKSSITGGFKSEYTVSPQPVRDGIFHGQRRTGILVLHYVGALERQSAQLTEEQVFARPVTLGHLISGYILNNIPVVPFLYVYTEGWKHDHESGVRGLIEINQREGQAEESHKLRLLNQQTVCLRLPQFMLPPVLLLLFPLLLQRGSPCERVWLETHGGSHCIYFR